MSKIYLVEVGKFLGIFKSQLYFKCLKIANGPHFLPRFIIQRLCTTIWPKGSYFIIFIYLFEFLIAINSFNKIKYVKNTKASFSNLFMHEISSRFRALSDMERIKEDWLWLTSKTCEKDLKNYAWKSNIHSINARIFWIKTQP